MARLLFCEDDLSIQKLISTAFRTSDHQITVVSNGLEGLEQARAHPPEVIITDLAMPVMDGLELWSQLMADPVLQRIPVVILTASVQRAQLDEMRARGLVHVLAKPFKMGELRAKVEDILQSTDTQSSLDSASSEMRKNGD